MRTLIVPFKFEHMCSSWIQDRHQEAYRLAVKEPHVQRMMTNRWSVTFLDAMTEQVLGCLGVLTCSRECWAALDRRTLGMNCYRPHRVEIARWSYNILQEREDAQGEPVYARVDGDDPKDEAFILAIGFKPLPGGEWYQRGDFKPATHALTGVNYDMFA